MARPKAGDVYTYQGEQPIGSDAVVKPGMAFTVREFVDAGVQGAHDDSEDSVVVEWEEPGVGYDDDGKPMIVPIQRAFSVGWDQFKADFQKGEG